LRRFLNVNDNDWHLVVGWLVQAFRPKGPYPVLVVHGGQGSAKSTLCRVLMALVDPNTAISRKEPKEDRDLAITANNSWVIAYDNLSALPVWLSDGLCRLSTGGGFACRQLYTDEEETIFDAQRPIVLNGIEELAVRGDLLDRSIIIYLPRIEEEKTLPEDVFWSEFDKEQPKILGALLTVVVGA